MKKSNNNFLLKGIFLLLIGGSLWGFSEMVFGEIIKSNNIPFRAGILTGIGFLIMGFLAGYLKKTSYFLIMAIPAMLIVQMGVLLCGNSVMCKTNTCVALICHTGMLSAGFHLTGMRNRKASFANTALLGSGAALFSAVAFYFIGMRCAPCPYLLSFNTAAGFLSYLFAEALPWMIFSGAGFSIGYFIGDKQYESADIFSLQIKAPHYIIGSTVALLCWIVSAGTILG